MTTPNYNYWIKKAFWRPVEAASLLLGSAAADRMEEEGDFELLPDNPIAQLERKIHRAVAEKSLNAEDTKLGVLIKPLHVLAWAEENQIELPEELHHFFAEKSPANKRGRPTAREEILAEAERRARTGDLFDDWNQECTYLAKYGTERKAGAHYIPESIKRFYQLGIHEKNLKIKRQKN